VVRIILQEGIDAVHHARVLAVTAHPFLPVVPDYRIWKNMYRAAAAGIDGIEG
jgi:predicted metal-dependent phosphoesterase TrpH